MPYKVTDQDALEGWAKTTGMRTRTSLNAAIESALNDHEAQGWMLAHLVQNPKNQGLTKFIFYRESTDEV